jgi:Thiamine monophosphate synthase
LLARIRTDTAKQHNAAFDMGPGDVDYSLYLVTDSTPPVLGNRDLVDVVEAALSGGVTICQYRDKTSDTVMSLFLTPAIFFQLDPGPFPGLQSGVFFSTAIGE